ncbi:polyadenylate-binding protein-interacting protein 9-like [Impatiens glandulifera]|uniref:polyadenylate-binding protein-interacting protein 9-like n=1 Tax=Impatiens glandulifera TaxID=253017 RepID=UPI001FB100E5|nr:polyadenylate-binding protein-interacting protein 9-like [Impatiens glandulifera]
MAVETEISDETAVEAPLVVQSPSNTDTHEKVKEKDECIADESIDIDNMFSTLKLNPMAKEFIPSSYLKDLNRDQFPVNNFDLVNVGYPTNSRRRRNGYYNNQGGRRRIGRSFKAQREDSIRRTVYVSDLDHNISEEQLAALFNENCGQVVDCRICGDPHSLLRFAFVEFNDERCVLNALSLYGTLIGVNPIKVLPSKTAILPVNPTFLPRSEDEKEMCARTVYCTNIDKQISQADVKSFFEKSCGEVSRLRLLGDNVHSTRIAFVEFNDAVSAIQALNCNGKMLGTLPVRLSPSKTPVRLSSPSPTAAD